MKKRTTLRGCLTEKKGLTAAFLISTLALAVVAVRIYNMNEPSRDAELLTLVNPWNTIPDGYEPQL